jgi:hypothetical protein
VLLFVQVYFLAMSGLRSPHFNPWQLTYLSQANIVLVSFLFYYRCLRPKPRSQGLLSELYTTSLGVAVVVTCGYWALRWVDPRLLNNRIPTGVLYETTSAFMHGGNLVLLLGFGVVEKVPPSRISGKLRSHLCWGTAYVFIQIGYWATTGTHIYHFLNVFSWPLIIAFEMMLIVGAVLSDILLNAVLQQGLEDEEEEKPVKSASFVELRGI